MQIYDALRPLEETLRQAVFEQGILFTDDTPVDMCAIRFFWTVNPTGTGQR
jgi:hypothetical protein